MKHLLELVNESLLTERQQQENKYDAEYISLTKEYLNILGEQNIKNSVQTAIDETNLLLSKIKDAVGYDLAKKIMNGQVIDRIIEGELAKSMNGCGGFSFKQGSEGKNDKDIECISIGSKIDTKYNDLEVSPGIKFDSNLAHSYGIELKCSQKNSIIGNKSYAQDEASKGSKKDKYSFYILITKLTPDPNLQITSNYGIDFCFLTQSDWLAAAKGNSAKIVAIDDRIIKLK